MAGERKQPNPNVLVDAETTKLERRIVFEEEVYSDKLNELRKTIGRKTTHEAANAIWELLDRQETIARHRKALKKAPLLNEAEIVHLKAFLNATYRFVAGTAALTKEMQSELMYETMVLMEKLIAANRVVSPDEAKEFDTIIKKFETEKDAAIDYFLNEGNKTIAPVKDEVRTGWHQLGDFLFALGKALLYAAALGLVGAFLGGALDLITNIAPLVDPYTVHHTAAATGPDPMQFLGLLGAVSGFLLGMPPASDEPIYPVNARGKHRATRIEYKENVADKGHELKEKLKGERKGPGLGGGGAAGAV